MTDQMNENKFPHLDRSPIVEAIFYFQARSNKEWLTDELKESIFSQLPDYPFVNIEKDLEFGFSQSLVDSEMPVATSKKVMMGLRFKATEEPHFALFRPDGLTFSRLMPYSHWDNFVAEAMKLWQVYCVVAEPSEIQRIGVRFINQISIDSSNHLADILREAPSRVDSLPLKTFFYQSTLAVEDESLEIGIIKTMSQDAGFGQAKPVFYLDIDVYSTKPISKEQESLYSLLPKLRYYKNKVFFDLLTEAAIQSFIGEK